jgi:hypothetical protein
MLAMMHLPFLILFLKSLFDGGWDRFAVGYDNSVAAIYARALSLIYERALILLNGEARWIACANASHFVAGNDE